MTLSAGSRFFVEYHQVPGAGAPWIVRLYRKRLFRKELISSDWFLDADQAKAYAESLAVTLRGGTPAESIRRRPPGWTLGRPDR